MSLRPETSLALGYAAFLLAVAEGLALLGRAGADARWPRDEAARFHAAIAAALVVLAGLVLAVAWLRHPDAAQAAPLALAGAGVGVVARRAVRRVRTPPSRSAPSAG